MKRRKPLQRKKPLHSKATLRRRTPLTAKSGLKPVSDHPAARRRQEALREAQALAEQFWGTDCILCGRPGDDWHHAYTRQYRRLYADWRNLWRVCRSPCHEIAQRGWARAALREATDYLLSQAPADGQVTPEVRRRLQAECRAIIRMNREHADRRWVSPIGPTD